MFFKRKKVSEGTKGLIHSLTNTPESWDEWDFIYSDSKKKGKEPELWSHKVLLSSVQRSR